MATTPPASDSELTKGFRRRPAKMSRTAWYRHRLAAMSLPELAHRVEEQIKRRVSRRYRPGFAEAAGIAPEWLPAIPALRAGLVALADDDALLASWRAESARLAGGTIEAMGVRWTLEQPEAVPDWHRDAGTGARWPTAPYCFDIDYRRTDRIGDVRFTWELARLQYLQPVAAHAAAADDAPARARVLRHLESWIDANPPYRGVHWVSGIELALRALSVIVIASLLPPADWPADLRDKVWGSLQAHLYWLMRFPSRFSSANNHRVAEAGGQFVLASLAPALRGAGRAARQGREILEHEIGRQYHDDGIGAEQASTYAAFSLEWFLLAAWIGRAAGAPFSPGYREGLARAASALRALTDSAGHHPRIGDDDEGRVLCSSSGPEPYVNDIVAAAAAFLERADLAPAIRRGHLRQALFGPSPTPPPADPGPRMRTFAAGGYTAWHEGNGGGEWLVVFDHGPLGHLSIAAHGHADALAVWLHVGGRPVLIDAGTYLYFSGADWRDHFRSSNAHNTLTINGDDSSEMAGPFNWSRKAECRLLPDDGYGGDGDHGGGVFAVEAEHDGYRETYGYRHRRRVAREGPGLFAITDTLVGTGGVERVEVGFLFDPALRITSSAGGWLIADAERDLIYLRHEGPLKGWLERGLEAPKRGWVSPRFGTRVPAPRLVFAGKMWDGVSARFTLTSQLDGRAAG